jgi:hypothetical protein
MSVLAAIHMRRPELCLRGRGAVGRGRVPLDSDGVGEIPVHPEANVSRSKLRTLENVEATNRNVFITGSDPVYRPAPRAAKSVTGSAVDHRARFGSGSPTVSPRSMLKGRRKGHQVGAGVDYLCAVLSQLGAAQRAVEAGVGVVTRRVDNGPRRPLNAYHAHVGESGLCHLLLQLSSGMEEGVGEPEGGVVHAGGQHWHQLRRDVGGQAAALRPVKDRHESPDGRGEQDPAGPQDSPRLGQRRDPLSSIQEVVERAEEEHRINRRIRLR